MRPQIRTLGLAAARALRPTTAAHAAPFSTGRALAKAAKGPAPGETIVKALRVREFEFIEEDDEDRPWDFSDISSLAHGDLEQHREARHYSRVAAYEMPRLARTTAPPPPCGGARPPPPPPSSSSAIGS